MLRDELGALLEELCSHCACCAHTTHFMQTALRLLRLSLHLQHSRFQQRGPETGMEQMQDVDGRQAATHPHPFLVHSET